MAQRVIQEKRVHRRLQVNLPLDYRRADSYRPSVSRTTTVNVSTGGVYFETAATDLQVGDRLLLDLGIPHDDNRFPQHGKISTGGQVVRTTIVEDGPVGGGTPPARRGVAVRFQDAFKLTF